MIHRISRLLVFCLVVVICFPKSTLQAQMDSSAIKQRDIIDVFCKVLHIKEKQDSVLYRPGKLYSAVFPGFGYTILTGFTAVLTANFSFYTNKGDSANISAIHTGLEYSQHKQFFPFIISNIWTKGNRYNFLGDFRYYNYSAYSYGLGSNSPQANANYFNYDFIRFYQQVLKRISPDFLLGLGYNLDYHWAIKNAGASPNLNDDYYKYGFASKTVSSGISANVLFDTRRNINNPVAGGKYLNLSLRQNLKFIGSNRNWSSLYLDLRRYVKFPARSKNILAFWYFNWLTLSGKPPYLDLPSTGWDTYDNTSRNYIQGRYRGKNMVYFETEYRFPITNNGLLGGAVYANMATLSNWPNNNFTAPAPNCGISLRCKANKSSNTNFVISYGLGKDKQRGFFFNLGEAF